MTLREQFEDEMGLLVSKASLMYAEWLEDKIEQRQETASAVDTIVNCTMCDVLKNLKNLRSGLFKNEEAVNGLIDDTIEKCENIATVKDDLKKIRNYFGENDSTAFEHWAYKKLDDVCQLLKKCN